MYNYSDAPALELHANFLVIFFRLGTPEPSLEHMQLITSLSTKKGCMNNRDDDDDDDVYVNSFKTLKISISLFLILF